MSILGSSSPRKLKYFRLLDKNYLPSLMQKTDQKDSVKATVSLMKKRKFIYLDMNATNGFKAMQQQTDPQSDDQDQRLGPYVVCQGSKTSRQKIKLKQFMTINHKTRERRNLIRSRVKEQLDRSKQRFKPIKQVNHKTIEVLRLHRGLQNQKFQLIKNNLQTEQINNDILKKQEKMMQKLGIVADFQSIKDRNTPSFVQKVKKAQIHFLPKLLQGRSF